MDKERSHNKTIAQAVSLLYKIDGEMHSLEKTVENKSALIKQLQDAMLTAIAGLVECRDIGTGGHTDRAQCYMKLLVGKMIEKNLYAETVNRQNMETIIQAAKLHDVGKIGIPDSILSKPTNLTPDEYEVMKTHVLQGKRAIDRILGKVDESELLYHAALMAYTHHERWDGTGYPQGLKGEDIPLHGRLMAIADVYDALISERPYKNAYSHDEAMKIITEGRGTQFDPVLTDLFIEIESEIRKITEYNRK